MRIIGLALAALGILALVYAGISYSRQRTILDVGSMKATATEQSSFPLSPIVGGIALISGILLLAAPRKHFA